MTEPGKPGLVEVDYIERSDDTADGVAVERWERRGDAFVRTVTGPVACAEGQQAEMSATLGSDDESRGAP